MKKIFNIIIVIFIALLAGAGAYYYVDEQARLDKEDLNKQITDLNKQLSDLKASPSSSPSVSTTADPTANWKTYTNTKYGFSFKYPKDWVIEEEPVKKQGILIWSAEGYAQLEEGRNNDYGRSYIPEVFINYYDNILVEPENVSSNMGAKTLDEYVVKNIDIVNEEKIDFASQKAYAAQWGGMGISYAILAEHNQNIIELRFNADGDGSDLSLGQKKIISSFQFTK